MQVFVVLFVCGFVCVCVCVFPTLLSQQMLLTFISTLFFLPDGSWVGLPGDVEVFYLQQGRGTQTPKAQLQCSRGRTCPSLCRSTGTTATNCLVPTISKRWWAIAHKKANSSILVSPNLQQVGNWFKSRFILTHSSLGHKIQGVGQVYYMSIYQIASRFQFCSSPQVCHITGNPSSYLCEMGKKTDEKSHLFQL